MASLAFCGRGFCGKEGSVEWLESLVLVFSFFEFFNSCVVFEF